MGKIADIMTADILVYVGLALILSDRAPAFISGLFPSGIASIGYLIFLLGAGMAIFNKFTR